MKLYHRTDFWGSRIQGRHTERDSGIPDRVFHVQAVLENFNNWWGCCQGGGRNGCLVGRRIVEINEKHFLQRYHGEWLLFFMCRKDYGQHSVYDYVLMPSRSTFLPQPTWILAGTVNPCMARIDLGILLRPVLLPNKLFQYPKNHVHIILVMDNLFLDSFHMHTKRRNREQQSQRREQQPSSPAHT